MNYFELFGLPVSPIVDKSLLAQKYFDLQKMNHPDFFSQATEDEQEYALQKSAAINKAFVIFQNSEKTLEYFLQEKAIIQPNEKYELPAGFLMEMMELNETLTEKDDITATTELANLEKELLDEIKPILEQSSIEYDVLSMEKLKAYYYKKKYLKRILDRLGD